MDRNFHVYLCLVLKQPKFCNHQAASKRDTKKKVPGGTWRLFLRLHHGHQRGLPNMRTAAATYSEVKHARGKPWNNLVNLSSAIQNAAKLKGSGHAHRLGLTAQQQNLSAKHNVTRRLFTEVQALPLKAQSDAILEQSAAATPSDDLQTQLSCAGKLAKSVIAMHASDKSDKLVAAKETLEVFDDTLGKQQLKKLCSQLPFLQGLPLKALPAGHLVTFFLEGAAAQRAFQAVSWSTTQKTPLGAMLTEAWERHHVLDTDPKLDGENVPGKKLTPCQAAGMCVCKGKGRLVRQCQGRVLQILKQRFNTKLQRETLAAGGIVIILSQDAELEQQPFNAAVAHRQGSKCIYVYGIALMYFSPYRPTLEHLHPETSVDPNLHEVGKDAAFVEVGDLTAFPEKAWEGEHAICSAIWFPEGFLLLIVLTGHLQLLYSSASSEPAGPQCNL
eukprot:6462242-Amphidinium_carterae.1